MWTGGILPVHITFEWIIQRVNEMSFALSTNAEIPRLRSSLVAASKTLETSMERLSSGKKINSASDDAAGFAISERMTTQIRGLNKVVSNINDAISLVSTAQGTTREAINIVQRIRELTVQGLSDTNGEKDKAHIQTEIEALIEEIAKIGENSRFNGRDYHRTTMYSIQTGIDDGDQIHFHTNYMDPSYLGNAFGNVSSFSTGSNATVTLTNTAWAHGSHKIAQNDVILFSNIDAPNSQTGTDTYVVISSTDNADGSQTITLNNDLSSNDATNILTGQGAIAFVAAELEYPPSGGFNLVTSGGNKSLANLDITDASKATTAIDSLDAALRNLTNSSTNLGAIENRLQFSMSNALSISQVAQAALSNIADADFAVESAKLTKSMVLRHSVSIMMAQSRAQPELVLSLLKNQ